MGPPRWASPQVPPPCRALARKQRARLCPPPASPADTALMRGLAPPEVQPAVGFTCSWAPRPLFLFLLPQLSLFLCLQPPPTLGTCVFPQSPSAQLLTVPLPHLSPLPEYSACAAEALDVQTGTLLPWPCPEKLTDQLRS